MVWIVGCSVLVGLGLVALMVVSGVGLGSFKMDDLGFGLILGVFDVIVCWGWLCY